MTLDGLETAIAGQPHRGTKRQAKLHLIRFADDFVIAGSSEALLGEDIEPGVVGFLAERGLNISAEKTRLIDIEEGFDFLGQHIRKYDGKLLIEPSSKSVQELLDKVRTAIKTNPTASAGQLIVQLNPLIRGWANYHRHVVSKKVFQKIDHEIVMALWRWAKRRHRNKSRRWIKAKYFGRNWVFRGQVEKANGAKRTVTLFQAAQEPIRRHVKVKADANPYDPEWEQYFEARLQTKMTHKLKGKRTVLQLWRTQQGICLVCAQTLTEETDWDRHHIVPRALGGSDTMDNLALLHPTCHTRVHSLGGTVLSPRPTRGR